MIVISKDVSSIYILQGEKERLHGYRYEVDLSIPPLGKGGMGQVFRGDRVDLRTGRHYPVAIKFLFGDLPERAVERARREAMIQIDHPNLVRMYGFFEIVEHTSKGIFKHYHVVSELLDGVRLFDLLNGRTTNKEGKEIGYARELYSLYKSDRFSFTLTIIKEILSGLSALHQQGYIHRDLDPSNIMITSDHKVKIIDYGIAKKITALNTQDRQLTNTGQFIGKAEYAAPELVMGDVLSHNQTTDLYAVGIIMFQLINGNPPFKGDMMAVVRKQIHDNLPLHTIPYKILRPILKKACAKRQSQRFQSAQQFLHALNEVEANVSKRADYRKILIYMAIILAIIVFIGLIIYLLLK